MLLLAPAAPAHAADAPMRVALIVGPVGEALTPVYIELAEQAAAAAEARGAAVSRAYSPNATATAALAAVEGANIVVYLGHGVGTPNPYSASPNPTSVNGWGLNGPNARGDHSDSWADGTLTYYGEEWLAAHARPAPGFVMIYSNACYAPGASEGFDAPATETVAAGRVSSYSRTPLVELGASAYFATDFYAGAAELIGALLDQPDAPFSDIFASDPRYEASGVARLPHAFIAGAETWLQRSAYFAGRVDYWYSFAGDPAATLADGYTAGASTLLDATASAPVSSPADAGVIGIASYFPGSGEGAGVALPDDIGEAERPSEVLVCADRCVMLPVVDSCPCYAGTPEARIANLTTEAWRLVSDRPLSDGLLAVDVYLHPRPAQLETEAKPPMPVEDADPVE